MEMILTAIPAEFRDSVVSGVRVYQSLVGHPPVLREAVEVKTKEEGITAWQSFIARAEAPGVPFVTVCKTLGRNKVPGWQNVRLTHRYDPNNSREA